MALSFMLSARGYTDVRAVRSAARALTVAESFRPGIVFLDFELPGQSSLDLAERLRRGAKQQAIRLIALTRQVEHPQREDARLAGFERFLVKPLVPAELDKILRLPPELPK
jgi:CheY-like chemotaxis protein